MNEKRWNTLAEEYHKFIISPFQKGVNNPLHSELLKLNNTDRKTVAEFGCGHFELEKFLSERFQKVYAFDFSEKMIEKSKENNNFSNVEIEKLDTTLMNFRNKFDVAISVNSIIMPSLNKIKISLNKVYTSLKRKGKFFLIVPAMESVLYEGMLVLDRESKKRTEKGAKISVKK